MNTLANEFNLDEEEGNASYALETKQEFFTSPHHDGSFEDIDDTGREMNLRSAIDNSLVEHSIEIDPNEDHNQMDYIQLKAEYERE
eukprot:CAMPEP_0176367402 /NCGR_PEP_ID=MMETSP0126-20121128/21855_1 /TAXON_ID=141414 ORGANISM="Strombidinopsis acuminatum, Strain SPMC142" /NCGR_SAMPLE_ID=MMETSP0126 /ASSEMBLY_ACC=CAM_ASM_000229 /LENGTH=85 /DNA_ID=CAMNT_0017725209 /DNA_START=1305 /DNA_END=1562 /DNA_ORIENTATION=+